MIEQEGRKKSREKTFAKTLGPSESGAKKVNFSICHVLVSLAVTSVETDLHPQASKYGLVSKLIGTSLLIVEYDLI